MLIPGRYYNMRRKSPLYAVVALSIVLSLLAVAHAATASTFYVPKAHQACKPSYHRETVKVRELRRVVKHGKVSWVTVRRHGKIVYVKQTRCVLIPPKTPAPTVTAPAPAPTAATATAPLPVRAGIDPAYTQDPTDPLRVTWDYSASAAVLPLGTLALTVSEPNAVASSGGCVINVGGPTKGSSCTLELPHYGLWQVAVTFAGSSTNVTPSTSTDTEDIEPLPATVSYKWGTDRGTANPTVSANVIGKSADVTVTDPNFEGATTLALSDDLGDSCAAPVSGPQATCKMPVTGVPATFQISYPGGIPTLTTQPVQPNGTQTVTTAWPAQIVSVTNPSVTVQQATVEECGSHIAKVTNNAGTCSYGSPTAWPNPISVTTLTHFQIYAVTYGSLTADRDPTHGGGYVAGYLTYTITGGIEGTDYTATDQQGSTPDNSTDCSKVLNQQYLGGDPNNPASYGPDEPVGGCDLVFQTPGQYNVQVTYHSEDPNYPDTNGPGVTVNVG